MPCPYFEPLQIAADPKYRHARLPLIDEYDGQCHAQPEPAAAPHALRFCCCNHGYSARSCDRFPAHEQRSAMRFHMARNTGASLEILCVEEADHVPVRWYSVQYFPERDQLDPEIRDTCVRAQIAAFCRSYLAHFPN